MPHRFHPDRLRRALGAIDQLRAAAERAAAERQQQILALPATRRKSATNLAHYLGLRDHDLRPLQTELRALSLSSLGRVESHVLEGVRGVQLALQAMLGEPLAAAPADDLDPALTSELGDRLLVDHAEQLLGPRPADRTTRIMVTLPAAAETDRGLVRGLLAAGMDIARINLAHDDEAGWTATAARVRAAAAELGVPCRILADLPGPKLRIGALPAGPRVLRVRPRRDDLGRVEAPALVAFVDPGAAVPPLPTGACPLPLAGPLADMAQVGDELRLTDTRGRARRMTVQQCLPGTVLAAGDRTVYFGSGALLSLHRGGLRVAGAHLAELPAREQAVPVAVGDLLEVTGRDEVGSLPVLGPDGRMRPARLGCTLGAAIADVEVGHRILFDDGSVHGVVEARRGDDLLVRVRAVPPGGKKLRAEKGINLPDSRLRFRAFSDEDQPRLDWIAAHADLCGMSFVQHPEDVTRLIDELARRGAGGGSRPPLGVVLKIETAQAFAALPELLLAGLAGPPLGVMVARGDLAAEVGYARLAEVQEEILWLCEAAHVPVIWATQVLDSMARTGQPSRAEVTDAAMGGQAECVMLNKGPYVVDTVRFLAGVLQRMQQHHQKKIALLRRLSVAAPRHTGPR